MTVGTPVQSVKHTPGPWRMSGHAFVAVDRSPTRCIAKVEPDGEDDPLCWPEDGNERESNRRLIAAAPDLLAALRGCRDMLKESAKQHRLAGDGDGHGVMADLHSKQADHAIKKATLGNPYKP